MEANKLNGEREIIRHVQSGSLRIDECGQIWRVKEKGKPCSPRRIEYTNGKGYLKVQIGEAGRNLRCFAHRLVWLFFYGQIPKGLEVNHKDLNKSNNHPLNFELIEHIENMHHAARHGRMPWRSPTEAA